MDESSGRSAFHAASLVRAGAGAETRTTAGGAGAGGAGAGAAGVGAEAGVVSHPKHRDQEGDREGDEDEDAVLTAEALLKTMAVGVGAPVTGGPAARGDSEASSALREWLSGYPAVLEQLDVLVRKLKRREAFNCRLLAKAVTQLLRSMVGTCRAHSVGAMMSYIRTVGKELELAHPLQLSAGNVVRRALFNIRQQGAKRAQKSAKVELAGLLDPSIRMDMDAPFQPFKSAALDFLNRLLGELEDLIPPITRQALDHIHASEVILTYGCDETVMEFLKAAAKRRKFEVFVAESAPSFSGHQLAKSLATAADPITVTVINDAAVFAVMSRVHKVIIGTHAVMANGGLLTASGGHAIALAAQDHSVPVVCCTGMYKLCPLYPHDQETFNELLSPAEILGFDTSGVGGEVEVLNPAFDYVPPELVELFVTELSGLQPSYVYRILVERYHPDDYNL